MLDFLLCGVLQIILISPTRRTRIIQSDPISITRAEFDEVIHKLEEAGVPIKADREQAWKDFAGWRVNYDRVLLVLCTLVMAPQAPWSSDRAPKFKMPPLFIQKEKAPLNKNSADITSALFLFRILFY